MYFGGNGYGGEYWRLLLAVHELCLRLVDGTMKIR